MKSKRWKQKEFSTETLTQTEVEKIVSESDDYDKGKSPVSRNTQYAGSLEDMALLQKTVHQKSELRRTHNYGVMQAVRDYNPGSKSKQGVSSNVVDALDEYIENDESRIFFDTDGTDDALKIDLYDDGFIDEKSLDSESVNEDYENNSSDEFVANDDLLADNDFLVEDDFVAEDGFMAEDKLTAKNDRNADNTSFNLKPLSPDDEIYDDIVEVFASNPTKPKYWFKEQGDHWYCSCGQLNSGDRCTNCGLERELLRTLFILREPGEQTTHYDINPAYNLPSNGDGNNGGNEIVNYDQDKRKPLTTKTKLIIAIAIILILLGGTGVFCYFQIIKPSIEAEAAANAKAAAESMESNVVLCGSNMSSFLRDSYITAGDNALDDENYEMAIRFYELAQSIEDSDSLEDKINEAKYQYVLAHKSDGGEKFETYLTALMKIGYSGISEIYDEYYAWHFNIIANTKADDDVNDLSTVSRTDTVYFHVMASGGAPDETIDVYYEVTWPDGSKQTDQIGSGWKAGSTGIARFSYPVPLLAREGTLTFRIYDKSTRELLGKDSVVFKK